MPDYSDALANMATKSAQPLTNDTVKLLEEAQKTSSQQIDIVTAALKPQASTFNGQMVLQDMIANKNADPINRAAAAQALNPGLKADVQADGTLAFSAAPGADLGFRYPEQTRKTTAQNSYGAKGKSDDAVVAFDSTYKAIQGMTDSNEIANAYATLTGSVAAFAESRRQAITTEVGQSMGLSDLETQMQADKVADQAFYNTYYNGQNLGPTDESLRTIALYNSKKTDVDQEVAKRLGTDPQLASMKVRMDQLSTLVDSKTRELLSSKEADKAAKASLIPPDVVDKTLIVLGQDPATATTDQRNQVALGIPTNPYYRTASNIGQLDSVSLAITAVSVPGEEGAMATRYLKSQFKDNPQDYKALVDNYQNFDSTIMKTLSKEEQKALQPNRTLTETGAKKMDAQRIAQTKMQIVIQKMQEQRAQSFTQSVGQWAQPQDPALQEIPTIIKDIQAQKTGIPVTIDQVVNRMDWTGPNRAAKIDAMTNYINSQANTMANNEFFGAPAQYANPQLTKQYVQTLAVKANMPAVDINQFAFPGSNRDLYPTEIPGAIQ